MNDIKNFINNNYNFKEYHNLLLRIANYKITGNPNNHYIKDILVQDLPINTGMIVNIESKIIKINLLLEKKLLRTPEDRLLFLAIFFHECSHIIQYEDYIKETDPIKQFYRFLKLYSASFMHEEDTKLHHCYHPEYEADRYALNSVKEIPVSQEMIHHVIEDYKKNLTENGVYDKNSFIRYPINGKIECLTMEQLELYKALFTSKSNRVPKVPTLLNQLMDGDRYRTMKENLQFLKKEQKKKNYNPELSQVILHVETNKLCSKIELLNDIITLLHEYIVPTESNIAFYTQLLRGKINLLLRIQNNLEERKVLWDYLEQLKGYYSCSDNTDFYSYYIEPCVECLHKVPLVKNDLNV